MSNRYSVTLNNYLQRQGQLHALNWAEEHVGQAGKKEWQVTCKINGDVKGVGKSQQKGTAKDLAAKQALESLGIAIVAE